MPKYDSDLNLGKLTDELNSDIPQEDINAESLKQMDREEFINIVSKRTSETFLKYYLESLKDESVEYYIDVMREIIDHFSLMPLKVFLKDGFIISSYISQVRRIVTYLKININSMILDKIITKDTNREEMEDLLRKDDKCPFLLVWALKFIDRESYDEFLSVILKDSVSEFTEENE